MPQNRRSILGTFSLEEDALSRGENDFSGIPEACVTIKSDKTRVDLEVGTRSTLVV